MPRKHNDYKSKIETYLSGIDHDRFLSVCRQRKEAQSAIAREAIRWYLENLDQRRDSKIESQISQSIKNMTGRICGMLARQGAQTGTLFELAWQNHVENGVQDQFVSATNLVKSKMRKRLEDDEKIIAERMGKVVEK